MTRATSADGTWDRVLGALVAGGRPDLAEVAVDSTVVRAHQHAAGARKGAARALVSAVTKPSAAAAGA